jgi:hypothetical protein
MTDGAWEQPDTPLERAHARLVAAIDAQPPGSEALYLARLVLLLLDELRCSEAALALIEAAREMPGSPAPGATAPGSPAPGAQTPLKP